MQGREEALKTLAEVVLRWIEKNGGEEIHRFQYQNYHGFGKATLPPHVFETLLEQQGFAPGSVQAELVLVRSDLRHEVHHHARAFALAICLGEKQGFDNPKAAAAFVGGEWCQVSAGDRLVIPPGMAHGFTVEQGGELAFLSLQSPPITGSDGADDYHKATA